MITTEQLLEGCAHETRIIQLLASKMPDGGLDYRPTPGQRSMLELMQYMTYMAALPAAREVDGDWERREQLVPAGEAVTAETFHQAMDDQLDMVRAEVAKTEGRDFAHGTTMPWGAPCTFGEYLVHCVLKTYAVYKMQFFLYLKSAGATDLGSMQCWAGMDAPPQP